MNNGELIDGEIYPLRERTTWKDWIESIAFGVIYLLAIYAAILFLASSQ